MNLSNELRKSDKMRGLLGILLLFYNEFNKLNNANVRFYLSYDIKITLKSYFCCKINCIIFVNMCVMWLWTS